MSNYEYDFSKGVKQYKKIIDGGEADCVPVTTQMAEFCMKYGGHNGREFFSNPELFVRGSLDVQQEMGFHVPAIRPPPVPHGTARLRITLCAAHQSDDVEDLVQALRSLRLA